MATGLITALPTVTGPTAITDIVLIIVATGLVIGLAIGLIGLTDMIAEVTVGMVDVIGMAAAGSGAVVAGAAAASLGVVVAGAVAANLEAAVVGAVAEVMAGGDVADIEALVYARDPQVAGLIRINRIFQVYAVPRL